MTPEDSARLGGLLLGQRLVALGVVAEGEPIVGLLPYVVTEDRTALVVQSSSRARHSRGLVAGAPWSGVIHEPETGFREGPQSVGDHFRDLARAREGSYNT